MGTQVAQDPPNHGRLVDQGDQPHPSTAPGAREHIEAEAATHQVGPELAPAVPPRVAGAGGLVNARRLLARGDDQGPPRRAGRQHTVVQDQDDPRARRQGREALEQLDRIENEMRRAIRPPVPEGEPHLPVRTPMQPVARHRGPQRVAAHSFKPLSPARHDDDASVEVEAA